MSNHPCHFCLVARDDLANINLQHIESRTHINMSDYLNRNLEKSVCIENMPNFFWTLP
jgi:hypothetical protein